MNDKTEISHVDLPYKAAGIEGAMIPKRGPLFDNLPVMVEASKLMARAGLYLPPHARDNPGACFAVLMKTVAWGMPDPFFMAEHSYVVKSRDGIERIAYDSAVFQAALMLSGAVRGRPQYEYEGEEAELRCTVSVQDGQTGKIESYTTPPVRLCKGHSPLWTSNPKQQLGYYGIRNLVRQKYQDVLAGFYDRDEMEDAIDVTPEPASPNLMDRLPGRIEGEGFAQPAAEAAREEAQAVTKAEEVKRNRSEGMKKAWAKRKGQPVTKSGLTPLPPPTTKAEYAEYAQMIIKMKGADAENWFLSGAEAKLRQTCKVDDMTTKMLLTLAQEAKRK